MKKLLIIFLVICSIISISACYATYSDIEGNKYEDSIEYLSSMGIILGYEDGTFKPDKSITRSEMAKLLVETSGVDIESVNETKSTFNDVSTSHWAIKYINIAQSQGLIKGDGNGNFRPNDTINYGETVTMVVRMLGYDVNVEGVGNWPDNYLKKADELNLCTNVDINAKTLANRGSVAQILYNAIKNVINKDDNKLLDFFDDVLDIGEAITLKRLENMTNQIPEWDGITSDDILVVNGTICNRFDLNANEEMNLGLSNLTNFAVDKETGNVYYIKGVIIILQGKTYTYYNKFIHVEGAKSDAIKLEDYSEDISFANYQNNILNNAKKAVFFNDVANINDGVTLKRLENMADQIPEWDGIVSNDTVIVNGITCNKFVSNANEEMNLSSSNDFAVDKETGNVYHIKGIVITEDGIPYTYYNSITYVEGAKSGAIKIQDYNR